MLGLAHELDWWVKCDHLLADAGDEVERVRAVLAGAQLNGELLGGQQDLVNLDIIKKE